jgi:hypothetical protein
VGIQVVLLGIAALALAAVAPQPLAEVFVLAVVLDGAAMTVVGG